MMDEEIRQALNEVREMKKMCGNINMKLTNIVTQRGQNWKEKLEAEYQRGLSEGNDIGYEDGVQDGRNEAWEAAKKLFSSMADSDIEKAFPIEWNNGGFKALMNLQPQEAIERLKSYEDDKIKRGDIVNVKGSCNDDLLGVVTKVWEDNCYITWGDGSGGAWCKESVVKTGKHIDVDKFLGGLSSDN